MASETRIQGTNRTASEQQRLDMLTREDTADVMATLLALRVVREEARVSGAYPAGADIHGGCRLLGDYGRREAVLRYEHAARQFRRRAEMAAIRGTEAERRRVMRESGWDSYPAGLSSSPGESDLLLRAAADADRAAEAARHLPDSAYDALDAWAFERELLGHPLRAVDSYGLHL